MDTKVTGTLHGWARTGQGGWLAAVSFSIPTGNEKADSTSYESPACCPKRFAAGDWM